jgi:hypothetical protein
VKALADLRDFLLASPALRIGADSLLTFAENGAMESYRADGNTDFRLSYDAHVIVTGFALDPCILFLVARDWLAEHAPNLSPDGVKFHVDIIDHQSADISLKFPLAETIQVAVTEDGTTLAALPEADAQSDAAVLAALGYDP